MATINNRLIHFKSKSDFDGRYAETTDGGKTYGDFLGTSIVFIQDAKQIWTHGQFYDANEATLASLGITATAAELNYMDGVTSNVQTQLNEIKESVDSISDPYEINLTNLLSAEDSESISTAIGGIDNLNATVQDNRIIVGTISNGSVSVSIRILGNITTLYYLLDSVLGLTLNEIAITNTSGTLSKNVTTHSVLTENMVINSLNSDETTLPLSAAQGKALNSKIDSIDVSADIANAINALDTSGQSADTGEVISSVSQENGVVSVSKKTLVSDDIPELPQSKITDLDTALAAKQNATDETLNTEAKTIVGAINEILPKATGVGKVDPNSDGTGEIFNSYEGHYANVASGDYSHAEGNGTKASGDYSHAEGNATMARDKASHAEGYCTDATGQASHAEGYYTNALNPYEHAEGQWNFSNTGDTEDLQTRHSVGIGTSPSDHKNAHEIMANGDHYIYGLGGYDGTNAIEETSQTLQEVINSKQEAITAGTGLEFEGNTLHVTLDTTVFKVVSVLPDSPAQGDENKIHLVPAESTGANNAYTEYVWVNSAWEILGEYTSEVDLTPYLKTADAANTYLSKTDAAGTYATKTDLEGKQDTGDYVTDIQDSLEKGVFIRASSIVSFKQHKSWANLGGQNGISVQNFLAEASGEVFVTINPSETEDSNLTTDSKNLTGAINEVAGKLPVYTTVPTLTADYNIPANATMVEKIYMITVGATVYNVTGAADIKWAGGVTPTVSANSILVVSVLNNLATWQTFI